MDSELRLRMRSLPTSRGSLSDPYLSRPFRSQIDKQSSQAINVARKQRKPISREKARAAASIIIGELTDLNYVITSKRRVFYRKRLLFSSLVIAFTLGAAVFAITFFGNTRNSNSAPALVANLSKPNFKPILPAGGPTYNSQISAVKFNSSTDSYSFNDTYLGAPLFVFEQPLQSNKSRQYKADQILTTIANKIEANTQVSFIGGTAYLTNSSKSNNQMIIFNDNGILVFIKSGLNIESNAWSEYIDKLYQG